jgi:hypothetical protein
MNILDINHLIELGVDNNIVIYDSDKQGITKVLLFLIRRFSNENAWKYGSVKTILVPTDVECCEMPTNYINKKIEVVFTHRLNMQDDKSKCPLEYYKELGGNFPVVYNGSRDGLIIVICENGYREQHIVLAAI